MSTKRTLSEAEQAPSKKQLSSLEVILIDEEKTNKRKVDTLGLDVDESEPLKSPKKSIERNRIDVTAPQSHDWTSNVTVTSSTTSNASTVSEIQPIQSIQPIFPSIAISTLNVETVNVEEAPLTPRGARAAAKASFER